MASKYKEQLRPKAKDYIQRLGQCGIIGKIDRFFQYHVKIAISQEETLLGNINLYYSPKKQTFKIATNEVLANTSSLIPILERCWRGEDAPVLERDERIMNNGYHLYVDGSFLNDRVGYGGVIVKQDTVVDELCGTVENPAMHSMRQVGGEIMAVQKALEWCRQHDVKDVDIFYDYAGVEHWVTGSWRAKNEFTQAYAAFVRGCGIQIRWHKIKSHSGDRWNDRADELAKEGTALKLYE